MKGLIIKDLYNISKNINYMILILILFAFAFISTSGIEQYISICGIMAGMMITTTFAFDTHSGWNKYAVAMPVSRNDLVCGKFIILLIFTFTGIAAGVVIGFAGNFIIGGETNFMSIVVSIVSAFSISEIFGSMIIPIMFKFNVEKGRIIIIMAYTIIAVTAFSMIKNSEISLVKNIIYGLPVIAVLMNLLMYKVSCAVLSRKDL